MPNGLRPDAADARRRPALTVGPPRWRGDARSRDIRTAPSRGAGAKTVEAGPAVHALRKRGPVCATYVVRPGDERDTHPDTHAEAQSERSMQTHVGEEPRTRGAGERQAEHRHPLGPEPVDRVPRREQQQQLREEHDRREQPDLADSRAVVVSQHRRERGDIGHVPRHPHGDEAAVRDGAPTRRHHRSGAARRSPDGLTAAPLPRARRT